MKDYSQNGESKVILELINKIGIENPTFIDIGAGDGFHLSNTRMLKDLGWKGKMIDADNKGNNEVEEHFITLKNVCGLVEKSPSLLSIDVDGNDYWILKEILNNFTPDVICFEVNSQLPMDECIVMPYNENHIWQFNNTFGMSYLAGFKLCKHFDYTIYDIVNSTNIIAFKNKYNIQPKDFKYSKTWSHIEEDTIWEKV